MGRHSYTNTCAAFSSCKRYRSHAPECRPPAPKICFAYESRARDIHHLNGDESDVKPPNLAWACRPCNVRIGNVMRRAGIGRKTRQYNPSSHDVTSGATSLGAWMNAVASIRGEGGTMPVSYAVALIHATPPDARSEFAREIWSKRKSRYGPTGLKDAAPF